MQPNPGKMIEAQLESAAPTPSTAEAEAAKLRQAVALMKEMDLKYRMLKGRLARAEQSERNLTRLLRAAFSCWVVRLFLPKTLLLEMEMELELAAWREQ